MSLITSATIFSPISFTRWSSRRAERRRKRLLTLARRSRVKSKMSLTASSVKSWFGSDGHPEPVGDVAGGVLVVERIEVIAEADPLVEVLETPHLHAELGEPTSRSVTRNRSSVWKFIRSRSSSNTESSDELGLVDDDDALTPGLVVPEEQVVQEVQELGLAHLLRLDSQLVEHSRRKSTGVQLGLVRSPIS